MTPVTRKLPGGGGPGVSESIENQSTSASVVDATSATTLTLFDMPADVASSGATTEPVSAIDVDRHTNGQRIADCARLGYLREPVVDPTYGYGGMWTEYQPETLLAFDVAPKCSGVVAADLGALPLPDNSAGSLVLDPPYKLGGTPTSNHAGGMDDRFGIDRSWKPDEVRALYLAGMTEAMRVVRPGGFVLVKCQDQISSGRLHLQTFDVMQVAMVLDLEVVDVLHLVGGRPQPAGRRQVHARRNYSTMIVLGVQ